MLVAYVFFCNVFFLLLWIGWFVVASHYDLGFSCFMFTLLLIFMRFVGLDRLRILLAGLGQNWYQ